MDARFSGRESADSTTGYCTSSFHWSKRIRHSLCTLKQSHDSDQSQMGCQICWYIFVSLVLSFRTLPTVKSLYNIACRPRSRHPLPASIVAVRREQGLLQDSIWSKAALECWSTIIVLSVEKLRDLATRVKIADREAWQTLATRLTEILYYMTEYKAALPDFHGRLLNPYILKEGICLCQFTSALTQMLYVTVFQKI